MQHADVKLLTILERVDPKPVGVEELPVRAVVLTAYGDRSSGRPAEALQHPEYTGLVALTVEIGVQQQKAHGDKETHAVGPGWRAASRHRLHDPSIVRNNVGPARGSRLLVCTALR